MNLGLRCGQILAERKKMNIIERSALWHRLERIGSEYPEEHSTPEPECRGTMVTYLRVDKKALELQKRIVTLEEEIKKARSYAKAKPKY